MLNNLITKAYCNVVARMYREDGITAIEYAIIGVAMSSALFWIFNDGNFLATLRNAWQRMASNITSSGTVLG